MQVKRIERKVFKYIGTHGFDVDIDKIAVQSLNVGSDIDQVAKFFANVYAETYKNYLNEESKVLAAYKIEQFLFIISCYEYLDTFKVLDDEGNEITSELSIKLKDKIQSYLD